jgi:hypothetical protein
MVNPALISIACLIINPVPVKFMLQLPKAPASQTRAPEENPDDVAAWQQMLKHVTIISFLWEKATVAT